MPSHAREKLSHCHKGGLRLWFILTSEATMQTGFFIAVVLVATFCADFSAGEPQNNATVVERDGKALSVFQVVRFPNSLCVGSSSLNGTCYTTSECTNKGGTSAGSCASGFGVCCTFSLGCGSTISENTTYFMSSTSTVAGGQCGVTVCECSSDVCQLRLDFNTFVIAGPSTSTYSIGYASGGTMSLAAGVKVTAVTQCQTDTFSVTGSPGGNPSPICGTNTGYHMYTEINGCSTLDFQLGPTGIGTTIPTRQWNIRITQISCLDVNKAPAGCTQWFFGSTTGLIYSYNYASSTTVQLANQDQRMCFRRERSYCKLCLSTTANTDFQVSSKTATKGFTDGSKCCGYGSKGTDTKGYDCLVIPGAAKTAGALIKNNAFCGQFGLVTTKSGTTRKTICTSQIPFKAEFITDSLTFLDATKWNGFKLIYWQTTC